MLVAKSCWRRWKALIKKPLLFNHSLSLSHTHCVVAWSLGNKAGFRIYLVPIQRGYVVLLFFDHPSTMMLTFLLVFNCCFELMRCGCVLVDSDGTRTTPKTKQQFKEDASITAVARRVGQQHRLYYSSCLRGAQKTTTIWRRRERQSIMILAWQHHDVWRERILFPLHPTIYRASRVTSTNDAERYLWYRASRERATHLWSWWHNAPLVCVACRMDHEGRDQKVLIF